MPNHIRKQFENAYINKINRDNSVRFNGYYCSLEITNRKIYQFKQEPKVIIDTSYSYLIFFEDGIFVSGFYDFNKQTRNTHEDNIGMLMSEIVNDSNLAQKFYSDFNWGVYTISEDTIIAKWVYHIEGSAYWYSAKDTYIIINQDSILKTQINSLLSSGKYASSNSIPKHNLFRFNLCEKMPLSNTWLKNNKWFWCDENEYKEWKKKIRKN